MKKFFVILSGAILLFGFINIKPKPQDVVYHKVGDKFGGGIVFFVRGDGEHGLIASLADQGKGVVWMKGADFITKDGVGVGRKNVATIMKYTGGNVSNVTAAAKLCKEFEIEEGLFKYDDWYLPSKLELSILYKNKEIVGKFSNKYYWTSTVLEDSNTWFQDFGNGRQDVNIPMPNAVRAIRTF